MENLSKLSSNTSSNLTSHGSVSPSSPSSWMSWVIPAVLAYPFLVAALRYRRIKGMQAHYGYNSRGAMARMTDQEAHEIIQMISELEFPALFEKGLQLALFRTYAIPSISRLLVQTAQLSNSKNVGRRYADTTVLIVEIYGNTPSSERAIDGIARLNYLHGHYIRQGKITNDDLLYTLALFMNKPAEWINKIEWRQLTDLEVCAIGVFHKSWGDAMQIDYGKLPGSHAGFRDGLQFYEELDRWSKQYEAEVMVPHQDNYDTAIETQKLLLSTIPTAIHGPIKNILAAAMDDQLRHSIMFKDPAPIYVKILDGFLGLRKYFLRYLALPRPRWLKDKLVNQEADAEGRRTFTRYDTLPIYVKPTFMNRWGPGAWASRLMGLPLPGDKGMLPEGFKTKDVGPPAFFGKGAKDIECTKERLHRERTGGCPFAILR